MGLLLSLYRVVLAHPCPHCQRVRQQKGSWFRAIRSYKCDDCGGVVELSYDTKLRLFHQAEIKMRAGALPEIGGGSPRTEILSG
jgi:transposase-like protein